MIELVARLVSLAIVLQTIELVQLRAPTATLFRGVAKPHAWLLWLRLALALVSTVHPHATVLAALVVTHIQLALLWRGSFNGGSDFMTLSITTAAAIGLVGAERGALLYIAIVTCNSYFIAGIAKVRTWRSGEALRGFLARSIYQPPPTSLVRPALSRLASWMVLALECAFPVVLVSRTAALVILPVMLAFHIANAWVFGLNRFLFAWLAAYPAVWACAGVTTR